MPKREPVLTPKQGRFIEEFLIDANATQAAIRAGYSRRTAATQGCRLFRNVQVLQELTKRQQARSERLEIDAAWVLRRIKAIVDRDPDGSRNRVAVKDLLRALELIGKHVQVNAFRERVQVTRDEDLIDAILSARKRVQAHGHLPKSDEPASDEQMN